MLVLALDTSGAAVTAALHDGRAVVAGRSTPDARRHAELLAPSIAAVLDEAGASRGDITAVAVGVGPGPFTGLRAGVVTARVLGLALGVEVVGVCSLDALALQVARDLRAGAGSLGSLGSTGPFAVATDARRHELYWALYEHPSDPDGVPRRLSGPAVTAPTELPHAVPVAGRGATLYPEEFAHPAGPLDVDAGAVAELAVRALSYDPSVRATGQTCSRRSPCTCAARTPPRPAPASGC